MPVVFDISSDEEQGLDEGSKSSDYDWIKELLSDEESEDSDEVVVVSENKPELRSKSSMLAVKAVDDDDDDCVVLDGDPEKGVTSVDEEATGSDELLVVGEKGQIACRDYPHARHLCAKYPFHSTPHERHCDQCHCFVCDSLAPCLKWGTGILSSDHCHANDKTEIWKIQRKNFKQGKSSPLPASTNYGTLLHAGHPQCNAILPLDIIVLSPNSMLQNQASKSTGTRTCSSLNSIPQNQASQPTIMCAFSPSLNSSMQNQVSMPTNIPVYSTAVNITIPNGANHGRSQGTGSTLVRNRYQPQSGRRHFLSVRNHAIQRERGSGVCSLGPQFPRSHMMSNRVGSAGDTLTVNHSAHGNLASYPHPSFVPASLSCVSQHTVASETQAYSQPLSQSYNGLDFYQSCIQVNDTPSSYVACLNSSQHGNELQIGSQNENASGMITQCGIASQDTYQPKPQEESASETTRRADFSAFDSGWTETMGQSIEPLIECSHLESPGSINQPHNVMESGTQFTGGISHQSSSLIDIENWLYDKSSVPMPTDGALPSELNIPSPDLGPLDTSTLLSPWW